MSQEETDTLAEEESGVPGPQAPPASADLQRVRLHSGYGIVGLVFGLVGVFSKEVLFPAFIGILAWLLHDRTPTLDFFELLFTGTPFCMLWMIAVPGLILSIAGLFQKTRRRETAVVGLALNAILVLAAGLDLYLHR